METILIIEDERNIRETLSELLDLAGYRTHTAANGQEGVQAIIDTKPDVVLCDVNMPEMDGFQVLSTISQLVEERGDMKLPPFIFLTARIEKNDIRKGMNLGADDYITKPFQSSEVLNAIRSRVAKRQQLADRALQAAAQFDKIALPTGEGLVFYAASEILRCEADRAYCNFYLANGRRLVVSRSLKEFESTLLQHNFYRVHKSNMINLTHIKQYCKGKGGYIILSDDSHVDVATRKKEELMNVLSRRA